MNQRRKPPQAWLSLHKGDMLNTRTPKHRLDSYLEEMAGLGYKIDTEEITKGYRLVCLASPHDKQVKPKLKLLKGGKDE